MNRRRIVREVMICLVLGVVLTVGVAWGLSAIDSARWLSINEWRYESNDRIWSVEEGGAFGTHGVSATAFAASHPLNESVSALPPGPPPPDWLLLPEHPDDGGLRTNIVIGYGWPVISFRFQAKSVNWDDPTFQWAWVESWRSRQFVIPLRPTLGAYLSAVLYAGLCWLMLFGPFAWRRFLRGRRGRCRECGYALGEEATCAECGTAA